MAYGNENLSNHNPIALLYIDSYLNVPHPELVRERSLVGNLSTSFFAKPVGSEDSDSEGPKEYVKIHIQVIQVVTQAREAILTRVGFRLWSPISQVSEQPQDDQPWSTHPPSPSACSSLPHPHYILGFWVVSR